MLIDKTLCDAFGEQRVFRSSRSMGAGTVFQPALVAEAESCAVMIAVIGERWLADDGGGRRIDQPGDWVRTEIALALANNRPVVPVLTEGRPKLSADDALPASIAGLVDRQYLRFHHRSAERDLVGIVDAVRPYVATRGHWIPGPGNAMRLVKLGATQRSADLKLGAAQIDGSLFGDSIVYRPSLFASGPRAAISFNLGRRFRRFEATVGVLDDAAEADQVGVFTVEADGRECIQVTVTQGRPQLLSVDVTNALNLKLEAYRPGTTGHPLMAGANMAGGVSNRLPELAWGDPMVYP